MGVQCCGSVPHASGWRGTMSQLSSSSHVPFDDIPFDDQSVRSGGTGKMVVTLIRDVTHTNVSLCLGSDTRNTHLLKDKLDDELASQLVHEGRTYVTYHVPHHTEPPYRTEHYRVVPTGSVKCCVTFSVTGLICLCYIDSCCYVWVSWAVLQLCSAAFRYWR